MDTEALKKRLTKSPIETISIITVIIHPIMLEKVEFEYLPMIFLLFDINITKTISGGAEIPLIMAV